MGDFHQALFYVRLDKQLNIIGITKHMEDGFVNSNKSPSIV